MATEVARSIGSTLVVHKMSEGMRCRCCSSELFKEESPSYYGALCENDFVIMELDTYL